MSPSKGSEARIILIVARFVNCEKWRKEFKLDDLIRHFDYKEKPQVSEYYPQYYHKTDKVYYTRA